MILRLTLYQCQSNEVLMIFGGHHSWSKSRKRNNFKKAWKSNQPLFWKVEESSVKKQPHDLWKINTSMNFLIKLCLSCLNDMMKIPIVLASVHISFQSATMQRCVSNITCKHLQKIQPTAALDGTEWESVQNV